jgi:hypothetical protein
MARNVPLWALFCDFVLFFECFKAANNRLKTRHVILRDRAEQFQLKFLGDFGGAFEQRLAARR